MEGPLCWKSLSKNEKSLTLFLPAVLAIVFVTIIPVIIIIKQHNVQSKDFSPVLSDALLSTKSVSRNAILLQDNVCLTKTCVEIATALRANIDESVDPCDDFFDFSCRGFIKRTIIPDEKVFVNSFTLIKDNLEERLKVIVERPINETDSPATILTKKFFRSCINETIIEKMGLKPLYETLDLMGKWPVTQGDSWNEANFSWIQAMYTNAKLGFAFNYIFDLYVNNDYRNSSRRIIWLNQPNFEFNREYLINGIEDSDVQAYLKYSVDVAMLLGANLQKAQAEMRDAVLFEIELAKISLPREELRNYTKLYNIKSLEDLEEITPQVPWKEYLNVFLAPKSKVKDDEVISVKVPNFFKNLSKLLGRTNNRTLANYILWRVIIDSTPHLSKDIRLLQLKFQRKLTGKFTWPQRWKECISLTTDKLPYAVGNLYVKNYFNEASKSQLRALVKYLREEFDRVLSTVDWMDETTRLAAMKKSKSIREHIGFPKELLMDHKLTEFYQNLLIDNEHLYRNILRINKFNTLEDFSQLRKPVDKMDWRLQQSTAQVNAFYNFAENSIEFPAGILQGVLFEPDRPQYMNYGGIGTVIGHEITHGFDDRGKQYNDNGDLQNWWNWQTEKNFQDKTNCIIWQYGNYTDPDTGIQLNGINTQGENIADCGGIKESYNSYQKWVQDNGQEPVLPGLKYNPNQLFWMSLGHISCTKYRQEALKKQVLTGYHTPWRFRVLGPLRNSKEFSKDWNCPLGSKMNPKNKCEVW